jgi:hypothetical protein
MCVISTIKTVYTPWTELLVLKTTEWIIQQSLGRKPLPRHSCNSPMAVLAQTIKSMRFSCLPSGKEGGLIPGESIACKVP